MLQHPDGGFRGDPMATSSSFYGFSAEASFRRKEELGRFQAPVERFAWSDDTTVTALALTDREISGNSLPAAGLIGVTEALLIHPDRRVALSVVTHERVHIQIGHDFRAPIQNNHSDLFRFFHSVMLPDWWRSRVEFNYDNYYIRDKGWDGLYGAWVGPADIEHDSAIATIDNYFKLLRKGLITNVPGTFGETFFHDSPHFRSWEKTLESPDRDIDEMYQEDKAGFARRVLTGFMLADYLQKAYRDAVSRGVGVDLWEFEEGLATSITSSLTGLTLDEIQQAAPQDEGKIAMARKIHDTHLVAHLLAEIRSYDTLASLARVTFR